MIASVHIADVGMRSAPSLQRRPRPGSIPGLRHADVALAAPLSATTRPSPQLGRAALISFWDDDTALDAFVARHPLAARFAGGWHARLVPLRMFGSWPGVPDDIPTRSA